MDAAKSKFLHRNERSTTSVSILRNLRICIMQLISNIPNIDSIEYEIAKFHFRQYVSDCFRAAQDTNEEGFFIDELFVAVSLAQLSQNTLHYLSLLVTLLDVNLGDKVSKANRIARDLVNIQPGPNPLIWKLLKKVLLWLNRSLRSSMQFIINPLRDLGWDYCLHLDNERRISGMCMIRLLMKNFPLMLENQFSQVIGIIVENVKSPDSEVRGFAMKLVKSFVTFSNPIFHCDIITLCAKINRLLNETEWKYYKGALKASKIITKLKPGLRGCFIFNGMPLSLLHERDIDAQLATCMILPFAYGTTSQLFSEEVMVKILGQYQYLISKKNPTRKSVLLSLGKLLFSLESYSAGELKIISKCHSIVEDSLDSPAAIFCLLSIDSIIPSFFTNKDKNIIFSVKTLSSHLVKGLNLFASAHPDFSRQIRAQIVSLSCGILFNHASTDAQLKLALKSLVSVEIEIEILKLPLVIQILTQLTNPILEVREVAAVFALNYQRRSNSHEVAQVILSAVTSETNIKLRLKLISEIICCPNNELISLLYSLLHDNNILIKKEALNALAKNANDPTVSSILSDFLMEKVITNQSLMPKERIDYFLIVSSHMEITRQILMPFSQYLIKHLIGEQQKLPSNSLELLSQLIKLSPQDVDIDRLVGHISGSLLVHSSKRRLDAALDLLSAGLKYTNLSDLIYSKHAQLYVELLTVSKLSASAISRQKLIRVLSSVGTFKYSIVHALMSKSEITKQKHDVKTAPFFIERADTIDPYQSLTYAAVGVALSNIFSILQDASLSALHQTAIESMLTILKSNRQMGNSLESYLLKKINFIVVNGIASTVSLLLTNMSTLISVLGDRFSPLVPHVVDFVCQKWNILDKFLLLRITEWLMMYVNLEFRSYIPRVVSVYLKDFNSYDERTVDEIVSAFVSFNESIEDVSHIVYPILLNWILYNASSTQACLEILSKIKLIFISGGASKYTSLVVRTCVLAAPLNSQLHYKLLEILCVVAVQSGKSFLLHLQKIRSVLDVTVLPLFNEIVNCLKNDLSLGSEAMSLMQHSSIVRKPKVMNRSFAAPPPNKSLHNLLNVKLPQKEWDDGQWHTWCTETFSLLLRCSSSRAISACIPLTERHARFRDAIYPLAFVLAYIQEKDPKNNVMRPVLELVFLTPTNVPRSIMRHFLAVIELMEIVGIKIPVSLKLVTEASVNVDLLAQALRTTETLFENDDTESTAELVGLNQKLGLRLAASGVLRYANRNGIVTLRATLSESLGLWNDALISFEEKLKENPNDLITFNRKLRCLQMLNKFDELQKATSGSGTFFEAIASFSLFEYDNFLKIMEKIKDNENDTVFYRAVFLIMRNEFKEASKIINTLLNKPEGIFPMIAEDYERVILEFAGLSNVAMLREIIKYKKLLYLTHSPTLCERKSAREKMNHISHNWSLQFEKLPQRTSTYFKFLTLEALMLNKYEMKAHWLKFIQTAIDQKDFSIALSVINYLKNSLEIDSTYLSELKLMNCCLLWSQNQCEEAITKLTELSEIVRKSNDRSLQQKTELTLSGYLISKERFDEAYSRLSKLGSKSDSNLWSQVNILLFEANNDQKFLVEAFRSLLENISKTTTSPLTLALQTLSILLRRGNPDIYSVFAEKVDSIPVSCWIEIIPQIMAKMSSPVDELRVLLQQLIYQIGIKHPQAVLYSLLVPYKSDNSERRSIASSLFDKLRIMFPKIVDGLVLLADELMRVAVSWLELCQTHLDDSSRAYFTHNNKEEMLTLLQPIQEIIKKVPETFYEVSFQSQFGQILQIADFWLEEHKRTHDDRALHQAWQQLTVVFGKLRPIINNMNIIPLMDASPLLSSLRKTEIAVPGTYSLNGPLITICSFVKTLEVIKSKQRPRKMSIIGSDGEKFHFLLKAHEDTRLDERVMQLFGYINTLIEQNVLPLRSRLPIITYKVIPFTGEVGLIGWVPDCTTLFDMLREYREKHNVQLEIEYTNTKSIAPNFENLPLDEKVDAFKKGISLSKGCDLRNIMLGKARDSADWLERRLNYTASLAITSMVGYILGLGDRHLCNIMMKSKTAKLVHIDFGDCFEVAMNRENYPEKVPIRLTRILVNALEVSKIEGTFRSCCENVMTLMRNNGNHILTLLEAFIYDPLMQWIDTEGEESKSAVQIVGRIKDKLKGNDFDKEQQLSVIQQVEALIDQATDMRNLCGMFKGWYPWW